MFVSLSAQNFFSHELKGRVHGNGKDVANVHVMNTTSGKAVITDVIGNFAIPVKLNDTLFFSAVQYKKKQLVISKDMMKSSLINVYLEDFVNELDEVVLRPYDLSGDLSKDMGNIKIEAVVTASTLGLPNAYVKPLTQSERLLSEAAMPKFNIGMIFSLPFNPIINEITGRTKMLKKRVALDKKYVQTQSVQALYVDSIFVSELKIPVERIADFMYFCEVDEGFDSIVSIKDELKIWEFLKKKSLVYRENNKLE
ncbi:MAG: hypothetical protein COA50_15610 [Flavobacteriaceae bacterium]|nr:MAG: hypothetical protein COA50_15610 [Flavobacteriaceae bacterium]